jgi:hypothetical protein
MTPATLVRSFVKLATVFLVLCASGFGLTEEFNVEMRRIHLSAAAGWQTGSLRASLRVALQVSQRHDRATASNRDGAELGLRDTHDSQGSVIEAGS